MRVRLKGIDSKRKKLADGRTVIYWYAWKGGPRLTGNPGDPEFVASYNRAVAAKIAPTPGIRLSVIVDFETTTEFTSLAERTRTDHKRNIDNLILPEFGDLPLATLTDRRTRGEFKERRDRLALKSRRQADYVWVVLARILSVARA